MPEKLTNQIISIRYYACGYCVNNLKTIFKKHKNEKRKFPAGVFLIEHAQYGYILFDTGYSTELYNCGFLFKVYNLLNPTFCTKNDEIIYQLKMDGISADNIRIVIVSHLHPDHIGCLKYFNNAKFILSQSVFNTYKNAKILDLVFNKLIPQNFEDRIQVVDFNEKTHDLFNDGSFILKEVNGHAKGQICAEFPKNKVALVADCCWGKDLIKYAYDMRVVSKIIQNDSKDYIRGMEYLNDLINSGVEIFASHDSIDKKELLKYDN